MSDQPPAYPGDERPTDELAQELLSEGQDADLHTDPDAPEAGHDFGLADARPPWRVAESLKALRDQINEWAPRRSKASDGTVADSNHPISSDHYPGVMDGAVGVVTAMDVTHDPAGGCDAGRLADGLVGSRDKRIKYVIWNSRIANASPIGGQPAWAWRPYTGKNPHNKHVHISVKAEKPLYDSRASWPVG